jgi:hypothetical protein
MNTQLDDHTADLATRLADVQQRIRDLTEQENELKAKLAANLEAGTYPTPTGRNLVVSVGAAFDQATAMVVLPHDVRMRCLVPVLDAKRVKQEVPPALYAQCQKPHAKPTVKFT